MKTIAKTFVAISILMISLQVIAGNNQNSIGQVHFKVQIHLPKDIPFHVRNIYVVMTDGNNNLIANPQLLQYGKVFYDFYEAQSVNGTRKAALIYSDGSTTKLFNCDPDVQNGAFKVGSTYLFNLYVVFPPLSIGEE